MPEFFKRDADSAAADTPTPPPTPPADDDDAGFFAEPAPVAADDAASAADKKASPKTVPIERLHEVLRQRSAAENDRDTAQADLAKAREGLAAAEGRASSADALKATVETYGKRYTGDDGGDLLEYDALFMGALERNLAAYPDAVKEVLGKVHEEIKIGKGERSVSDKTLLDTTTAADAASTAPGAPAPANDPTVKALLGESVTRRVADAVPSLKPAFRDLAVAEMLAQDASTIPTGEQAVKTWVGKFFQSKGFKVADVLDTTTPAARRAPNTAASAGADRGGAAKEGEDIGAAAAGDSADGRKPYKSMTELRAAADKRRQGLIGR